MSNDECLFCGYEKFHLVAESEHTHAIRDKYPYTELHTFSCLCVITPYNICPNCLSGRC